MQEPIQVKLMVLRSGGCTSEGRGERSPGGCKATLASWRALRLAINGRPQCSILFEYTYHCINVHIELDLGFNFHGKIRLSVVLRIKI